MRSRPAAVADSYSLNAQTPFDEPAPGVLGNDPDTSELSAVLVSGPSHDASFKLNPDGSFSYTPSPGFAGTDSFTYSSKGLGGGVSEPTTVTLDVVGQAPSFTSNTDRSLYRWHRRQLHDRDHRSAGIVDHRSVAASGRPHVHRQPDGTATISGTPAAGTQGSYPITVTAANGQGSNATQTLTLAVAAPVTPAPAPDPCSDAPPPPATSPTPLAPTMAAPAPTPLTISTIGLSRSDVVWCFGQGCKYPDTHVRFTLSRAAPVRMVLQASAKGNWKNMADTMVSGHPGSNNRRSPGVGTGLWSRLVKVRVLVQLKAGSHWTTRKTLRLFVKHRHK